MQNKNTDKYATTITKILGDSDACETVYTKATFLSSLRPGIEATNHAVPLYRPLRLAMRLVWRDS